MNHTKESVGLFVASLVALLVLLVPLVLLVLLVLFLLDIFSGVLVLVGPLYMCGAYW